jgi:hypothetical protein
MEQKTYPGIRLGLGLWCLMPFSTIFQLFTRRQDLLTKTQVAIVYCGCDRVVVGFTTAYAISTYHH